MTTARCRSCDAPIIWATSAKSGKAIPLDRVPAAETSPNGMFVLAHGRPEAALVAISAQWFFAGRKRLIEPLPAFYRSHFATCPDADQHRRRLA